MKTAEQYFWENLPKRSLTSKGIIDRQKINFDDVIELMESYAKQQAVEFAKHSQDWTLFHLPEKEQIKTFKQLYNKWKSQ